MFKRLITIFILTLTLLSASPAFAADQTVALRAGFNFISFTVAPTATPASLKQLNPGIDDIYYFNAAAGSFISLSEGALTSFAAGKGYIFKAASQFSIMVSGNEPGTVGNINLKTGFNLVGFSKMPETKTGNALMTSYEAIRGIYKWIPASGSFIQIIRNSSGAIEQVDGVDPQMKAGEAYFMNFTSEIQLNYDSDKVLFGTNIIPAAQKAAVPVMTPSAGLYTAAQTVQITCATAGASIYYTTDGSTPSAAAGTLYSGPITVSSTKTIKAVAIKSGYTDSDAVNAYYMISTNAGEVLSSIDITAAQTAAKRFMEIYGKGSMGDALTATEVTELKALAATDFMLNGINRDTLIQYASEAPSSPESEQLVSFQITSQPLYHMSSMNFLAGMAGTMTVRNRTTGALSTRAFDTISQGCAITPDYKNYYSRSLEFEDGPPNLIVRKETDGKWRVAGNGVKAEEIYMTAQYQKDIGASSNNTGYARLWFSVNESSSFPIQSVSVSGGYVTGTLQLEKAQGGTEWRYKQGNTYDVATNPDWSLYPVKAGQQFTFTVNYTDGSQQTFVLNVSTVPAGIRPLDGTVTVSGNTVTLTWEKCPFADFKNYEFWNSISGNSQEFSDINSASTTLDISGASSGSQIYINVYAKLNGAIQTGYFVSIIKQ